MVENTLEIAVPITLKGGREGDKVGKQIGEKIATQLNRSLKAIGVGGGQGAVGDASGILGLTKSMKGVAVGMAAAGVALAGILSVLKKSSPYLQGILSIFGRAFMIFFRPFGDFLATLLRPMAVLLMRAAVAWLRWTRKSPVGKALFGGGEDTAVSGGVKGAIKGAVMPGGFGGLLGGLWGALKEVDWGQVGKSLKDFSGVVKDKIIGFPDWLWNNMTSIWNWTFNYANWIWGKITSIWNWGFDLGSWLWGIMTNSLSSVGTWLSYFGSWLWSTITNSFGNIGSWLGGIGKYLYTKITDSITSAFSNFSFGWSWFWQKGAGQVGIANVPSDGMYKLHKGEEVVPRTKVGRGNKSIIVSPTFNITGMQQGTNLEDMARRASMITVNELKSRGILNG